MARYHLAQVNVGRILFPMDDPRMHGFASRLDEINALAESTPGFVWRLKDESGNATSLRPWEDDSILINMSVWESVEQLFDFAYRSVHKQLLAQRKEWFSAFGQMHMAMWWIPAGTLPTPMDAKDRLDHIHAYGPTPYAFTFRTTFPAPADGPDYEKRAEASAG